MAETERTVTACMIVIGNEILSGRTPDANLAWIAAQLNELGIRLLEARVIPDLEQTIVDTVNAVRAKFDYVFTSGGIGPTHDDITADSIAKAFGVGIGIHPEARRRLEAHYAQQQTEFNEARQRMARIPEGAALIDNPISRAPGFRIGNVFVMAGIPVVMRAMFESIRHELVGGAKLLSRTVSAFLPEGKFAAGLGRLQAEHPELDLGSYPFYRGGRAGASIVLRGTDTERLAAATDEVKALVRALGGEPVDGDPSAQ
jgi:molybdenum cofactor synthesis domain-containing protein